MIQFLLALFGVSAVYLTQSSKTAHRKYAPIVGLLGQPFWFIAAWDQPGMLFVVTLYTLVWMKGVYINWIAPTYNYSVKQAKQSRIKGCKVCAKTTEM